MQNRMLSDRIWRDGVGGRDRVGRAGLGLAGLGLEKSSSRSLRQNARTMRGCGLKTLDGVC